MVNPINEKYLSIDASLEIAKNRAEVTDITKEESLLNLLEDTAGRSADGLKTVYRPYFAAARYLEQDHQTQKLSEAGDVKFTNLVTVVASLYAQQAGLDGSYGLLIPDAFLTPLAQETRRGNVGFGTVSTSLRVVF